MCLPNFIEFREIDKESPIIGYRNWRIKLANPERLISQSCEYIWDRKIEEGHLVTGINSGIYAYNYNHYYYNNNNNYYNYNDYYNNNYNYYNYNDYYNNYNDYYYNNYNIAGIIYQYGRTAIHSSGQRSENARIKTLFTVRESDAVGPDSFLKWIEEFNLTIRNLAIYYEADTIHWQDWK